MQEYLNILRNIRKYGKRKHNRTGIDTYSISGAMFEHDLREGFPLLTTKKMPPKTIFAELEGFIKGITDKQWYKDRKCNIWNEWCNPQKVHYANDEETKELMYEENDLGKIYGYQWNNFNDSGVNQLQNVLETLKTNPYDRRMIVMAWNPCQLNQMALPPCHYGFQLLSDGEYVDLLWNQRSVDTFLGLPFNIASYAMLLTLIAEQVGMIPRKLIGFLADVHLYENQMDCADEQLTRTPFKLPTIKVIKLTDFAVNGNASETNLNKDWTIWDWKYTQFELINYQCHDKITCEVAV